MQLQIVDPIPWVIARPTQFFRSSKPDAVGLLAYVMADVLLLGGGEFRVGSRENWWFASSNTDWMKDNRFGTEELFSRVIADPRLGEHSMRAEILLNAFASDVVAAAPGQSLLVKGQAPSAQLINDQIDWSWCERALIFRL